MERQSGIPTELRIALFARNASGRADEIAGLDGKTHGLESVCYSKIEPAARRDSVATSLGFRDGGRVCPNGRVQCRAKLTRIS
jgi:hypothetical protein